MRAPSPPPAQSGSLRLFTAIAVPASVRERLAALQLQLAPVWPAGTVRWTRPHQMHLTLRFHGQVPEDEVNDLATALRQAANRTTAFTLRLGKLGAFPQPERPRVLWAGLKGDLEALDTTADRVATASANWGDHQEEKPFHPHLTLGRLPFTPPHVASTAWWQIDPGEVAWEVGEFCLFQSSLQPGGAHHQALATFPLSP